MNFIKSPNMDFPTKLPATKRKNPVYLHVITYLCLSLLYAWQELLPSMKDVYGVELEEPKRENMKDYERYCLRMPCVDIPAFPVTDWLTDRDKGWKNGEMNGQSDVHRFTDCLFARTVL